MMNHATPAAATEVRRWRAIHPIQSDAAAAPVMPATYTTRIANEPPSTRTASAEPPHSARTTKHNDHSRRRWRRSIDDRGDDELRSATLVARVRGGPPSCDRSGAT